MEHQGHALERQRVARHVRLDEPEARMAAQAFEVPLLVRAGVERVEVVEADDLVAAGHQGLAHMRSDEPRRAGDESALAHVGTIPRK